LISSSETIRGVNSCPAFLPEMSFAVGRERRQKILLAKRRWFSDAMARYVHRNLHSHCHAVQKRRD
jgi:hypothetical protein